MIKAVIFDMDGLIIDSEHLQSRSFEAVIRSYGKAPIHNYNGLVQQIGIRSGDNWKMIMKKHAIQEDLQVLNEKKRKAYVNLLENQDNIKAMPGLYELLDHLKKFHIQMAIASSSSLAQILLILEGLHIKDYFDVIVSAEDLSNGKPDPEIFLKAAKVLKVKPKDCLVLEDSQVGIEAAFRADMRAIAIPNIYTKDHDFSRAEKVLKSLFEVKSLLTLTNFLSTIK